MLFVCLFVCLFTGCSHMNPPDRSTITDKSSNVLCCLFVCLFVCLFFLFCFFCFACLQDAISRSCLAQFTITKVLRCPLIFVCLFVCLFIYLFTGCNLLKQPGLAHHHKSPQISSIYLFICLFVCLFTECSHPKRPGLVHHQIVHHKNK